MPSMQHFLSQAHAILNDYSGWKRIFHLGRNHIPIISELVEQLENNSLSPSALINALDAIVLVNQQGTLSRRIPRINELLKNEIFNIIRQAPENLSQIITEINMLSPQRKLWFLNQVDSEGKTILFLTAQLHPTQFQDYLELILNLPEDQQPGILNHLDNEGHNLLMITAIHQPTLFFPLFSRLSREQQINSLTHTNNEGRNLLMLAVQHNPTLVPDLLKLYADLPEALEFNALKQLNNRQWNIIMLTVRYSPDLLPTILESIKKLSLDDQLSLLNGCSSQGWNALMIAIREQQASVIHLTRAIAHYGYLSCLPMLTQRNHEGWNALMMAIYYYPEVIRPLIELLNKLPIEKQAEILTATNQNGWNAFMIMIEKQPLQLIHMVASIQQLPIEIQRQILTQWAEGGTTPLMTAMAQDDAKALVIFKTILTKVPDSVQQEIFLAPGPDKIRKNILIDAICKKQYLAVTTMLLFCAENLSVNIRFQIASFTNSAGHNLKLFISEQCPELSSLYVHLTKDFSKAMEKQIDDQLQSAIKGHPLNTQLHILGQFTSNIMGSKVLNNKLTVHMNKESNAAKELNNMANQAPHTFFRPAEPVIVLETPTADSSVPQYQ